MQWIRNHLSFANAISMIALFVALGGTSVAAISLSKNSVGTKQIKKNGVRAIDIARNAVGASEIRSNAVAGGDIVDNGVGAADIADNGVGAADIADNGVGAAEIANNAVGASELADNSVGALKLLDNSVGSAEVTNGSLGVDDLEAGLLDPSVTVQFEQATAALANGAETSVDVHCPAGQTAIGGGTRGDLTNSELTKTTASRPIISTGNSGAPADDGTFTGWRGTFVNENNGADIRPEVWVVCAG